MLFSYKTNKKETTKHFQLILWISYCFTIVGTILLFLFELEGFFKGFTAGLVLASGLALMFFFFNQQGVRYFFNISEDRLEHGVSEDKKKTIYFEEVKYAKLGSIDWMFRMKNGEEIFIPMQLMQGLDNRRKFEQTLRKVLPVM